MHPENVIGILIVAAAAMVQTAELKDFCQFETFNATCSRNEVVLIEQASYGRMKVGRCLERDYGYVGCYKDVTSQLDMRCSGRRTCAIAIPDAALHSLHQCPSDMSAYLEASYSCLPVLPAPTSGCPTGRIDVTASSGILASASSLETSYGTDSCPWNIRVEPGQRVNITLIDYSVRPGMEYATGSYCVAYATFKEPNNRVTLCGGQKRMKTAYISKTNEVEIRFIRGRDQENHNFFLLKYDIFGCKPIKSQGGAVIEYMESSATITCPGGKTWKVECLENKWLGQYENCTSAIWQVEPLVSSFRTLPAELTVALISGIAFVVIIFILVVGLFCIRKHRMQRENAQQAIVTAADKSVYGPRHSYDKSYSSSSNTNPNKQMRPCPPPGSDYTSIWESQHSSGYPTHHVQGGGNYYPTQPFQHGYDVGHHQDMTSYNDQHGGRVEHIYESPKFERSAGSHGNSPDLPVYYELDGENDHNCPARK